jgi:phosphatidylcholine synthase
MLAAWSVHLLTALGAVIGLLGVRAASAGDLRQALIWMFVATFIDAIDGVLARAARVKERVPWFNGARLDDIVDYLTFVFLPAVFVYEARLVPDVLVVPVASAMLLSSAYGFSREDAKTADHFFTGFPSYWNIVVFYLYVLGLMPRWNAIILLVLAALVFVPIRYVYPSRTPTWRSVTVALGAIWAVAMLIMVWQLPVVSPQVLAVSMIFPIYYTALSFYLNARRRSTSRS